MYILYQIAVQVESLPTFQLFNSCLLFTCLEALSKYHNQSISYYRNRHQIKIFQLQFTIRLCFYLRLLWYCIISSLLLGINELSMIGMS